jgi:hypothetical protein
MGWPNSLIQMGQWKQHRHQKSQRQRNYTTNIEKTFILSFFQDRIQQKIIGIPTLTFLLILGMS